MKEIARILYGSQNLGLSGPESDKDYKIILCPNFSDLYNRHEADKKDLPEKYQNDKEHNTVVDIRKFFERAVNGNVNAVEMLFSTEIYSKNEKFSALLQALRDLYSDGYLLDKWDNFYSSLTGLVSNSLSRYNDRKTQVRANYYLFLLNQLVKDNFKMTGTTWRNNDWSKKLQQTRFNELMFCPPGNIALADIKYMKTGLDKKVNKLKDKRALFKSEWIDIVPQIYTFVKQEAWI